jgi:hypothetical protein
MEPVTRKRKRNEMIIEEEKEPPESRKRKLDKDIYSKDSMLVYLNELHGPPK